MFDAQGIGDFGCNGWQEKNHKFFTWNSLLPHKKHCDYVKNEAVKIRFFSENKIADRYSLPLILLSQTGLHSSDFHQGRFVSLVSLN